MFERFTDSSRRVVVLAQEEARLLGHNYIGTEHLLLGLLHEGESVGAVALAEAGVTLQAVRDRVRDIIGETASAPSGHIPFTPRAKKVLELSLREALQLGHNYIGTEHILLGLIREGEGVAPQVLVAFGIDLGDLRHRVLALLGGAPARSPASARSGAPASACSFCGRDLWEVERHVRSRLAVICDQCVDGAGRAMAAGAGPSRLHLPPRVFALERSDQGAVAAIVESFTVVFGDDANDEERSPRLQDGAALATLYREALERIGDPPDVDVVVERIRFLDHDRARVGFAVLIAGGQYAIDGHAHRADEVWRVSRGTFCQVVGLVGVRCPTD